MRLENPGSQGRYAAGMTVEVKTKLTLDDHASASTARLKESFEDLRTSTEKAQEGFSAMSLVVHEYVVEKFREGIATAKEFGASIVEAAAHGQDVEQRLAGMTTVVQGIPWDEAAEGATRFFDGIQEMSERVGQPIDDIEAGFNRLVEIRGATPQGLIEAREQVEQMANVARVVGGNVEGWVGQFAFAEEGALKVKSQMYQLLEPTGIFEHKSGKVTEWWSKLSEGSRAELLATGLERLSNSMAAAPPTFNTSVNQLKNIWDQVEENLGTPIAEGLQPQIEKLSHWLKQSDGDFEHYARMLGDKVGEWVKEAADTVKEGLDFIQEHEHEIAQDIKDAWAFAKQVMDFIVQHKEVLAAVAVGRSELGKGAISAATGLAGAVMKNAPTEIGGAAVTSFTGGALAFGALTAAVVSSTIALQQWDDLMSRTGGGKSDDERSFDAIKKRLKEMIQAPDLAGWNDQQLQQFDHMRANLVRLADEIGEDARAAGELGDQAWAAHNAVRRMTQPVDEAAESLRQMAAADAAFKAASGSGGPSMLGENEKDWAAQDTAIAAIADGFSQASAAHNQAVQQYVANLLAGDVSLQTAFLQSANMSAEGFNNLADMLAGSAKEFAEKLRGKAALAGNGAKEVKPVVNFNGGQSFKIQQDFRDQDPDRIAVIFQHDVLKSAERRLQAVTSTPFSA